MGQAIAVKMVNWYVWKRAVFAAFGGFFVGHDAGMINGVKDMTAFREAFDLSIGTSGNDSSTCNNSVGEGALLGLIASTVSFGAVVGCLLAAYLSDKAGRKPAIMTSAVLMVIGSGLQAGAYHLWLFTRYDEPTLVRGMPRLVQMVFAGRAITGIGNGLVLVVAPVYVAELAPREIRGRLTSFFGIFATAGFLVAVVVNFAVSEVGVGWRISLGLESLVGSIMFLGMVLLPETPRWLVKKRRHLKAIVILTRVHQGDQGRAEAEVEEIRSVLRSGEDDQGGLLQNVKVFFTWRFLRRILIGMCLMLFQRVAGIPLLSYYSVTIFCQMGVPDHLGSILFGLVYFLTTILTTFLVDKAGRKPLLLLGTLKMTVITLITATLVLAFRVEEGHNRAVEYIAVVLILLFVASYSYSFLTIPFIVNSEIHPLRIRALAGSVTTVMFWLGNLFVALLSPILLASPDVQLHGTLYILAGINFTAFLFILLVLPETKGVSLENLDSLFSQPWLQRTQVLYYLRCGGCLLCGCKRPQERRSTHLAQVEDDELKLINDEIAEEKFSDAVTQETCSLGGPCDEPEVDGKFISRNT